MWLWWVMEMVVVMVSGVEWMRDGGGWAGAAYMVNGGGGRLPGKSIFVARSYEHQSQLLTSDQVMRAQLELQNSKVHKSRAHSPLARLRTRPDWEGARSLIWKARPCVGLIWRWQDV